MQLKKTLEFLTQLRDNNDRTWFHANKALYDEAKIEFEYFINAVIPIIKEIDSDVDVVNAKECTFRIFRDVRFSKNKMPYKTNFGAFISKGGRKSPYAGYYLHVEPGQSFVGGGIYMPESKYLNAIRTAIYENAEKFKGIINNEKFKTYFNEIYGEKLKSYPRGFPKDFADLDLLKHKHYAVVYSVDDSFWNSDKTQKNLKEIFESQYSFNAFLNDAIKKVI